MYKIKKYLIATLLLLVPIFIIILLYNNFLSTKSQLKRILKEKDFTYEQGEYTKQTSVLSEEEYFKIKKQQENAYTEKMYFDIDNYTLKKSSMDYYNGLTSILNAIFMYKEGYLEYNYELNYNNNSQTFIFEGYYLMSGDYLKCNLINSQKNNLNSNEKETICESIEKEIDRFSNQAVSLFEDTRLEDKMLDIY